MKQWLFIPFCFACLFRTWSQQVNYGGLFTTIDHSGQFADKLSYNTYLFAAAKPYSHQTALGGIDQARILYVYGETGLSYDLLKQLTFTASYVYERQHPFEDFARNEHRFFQQLTLKLPVKKMELKQRLRFDERFIRDNLAGTWPFSHRLRYLLGASRDISDKWYGFVYTEFFFNTTRGAKFQFNENWSAAQVGYRFNKTHSLEFGYLFVGWVYNNQNNWFNQHYLQTTWVSKLDFRKKKNIN